MVGDIDQLILLLSIFGNAELGAHHEGSSRQNGIYKLFGGFWLSKWAETEVMDSCMLYALAFNYLDFLLCVFG
jgi:hypothetical protein